MNGTEESDGGELGKGVELLMMRQMLECFSEGVREEGCFIFTIYVCE